MLNKLGNDSELIVMNAAGMPPWVLFRPFLAAGIVVSLLVTLISIYVSPWGLRELRRWATEVRADLVSNVIQPGRFTKLEERLTLHIRERHPNGQLLGIFIDDQRNPKERVTILAEQGDIVKNERGAFSCWRMAACSGTRPDTARSRARAVRQLWIRSVLALERNSDREILGAGTLSVGAL